MFKLIVCTNNNLVIGKDGGLLYHISDDLKNFRRMTIGQVVVMGRKTFESLPNKKPLRDRTNIVVTSSVSECTEVDGALFVPTIEDAVRACQMAGNGKEWYVIGGGSIYQQFLERDLIDTIYQTEVIDNKEGDVKFPDFKKEGKFRLWYQSATQFNQPPYVFSIWKRTIGN